MARRHPERPDNGTHLYKALYTGAPSTLYMACGCCAVFRARGKGTRFSAFDSDAFCIGSQSPRTPPWSRDFPRGGSRRLCNLSRSEATPISVWMRCASGLMLGCAALSTAFRMRVFSIVLTPGNHPAVVEAAASRYRLTRRVYIGLTSLSVVDIAPLEDIYI